MKTMTTKSVMLLAGLAVAMPAFAAAPQGDPARGKVLFIRCAACHSVSAKAPPKIGPQLEGVVGRKSGSVPGYRYSPAMQKAGIRWDAASLDKWLTRPMAMVPGTTMSFPGLSKPEDRAAVIAYLRKPVP